MPEHEFAVWAPRPALVRLDFAGALYPMTRCEDGWWRATVDVAADARYGFVLDDDPTVLPDPRSPRQPDGVHERSQLWRPAAEAFSDGDWAGRSIEGAVMIGGHRLEWGGTHGPTNGRTCRCSHRRSDRRVREHKGALRADHTIDDSASCR